MFTFQRQTHSYTNPIWPQNRNSQHVNLNIFISYHPPAEPTHTHTHPFMSNRDKPQSRTHTPLAYVIIRSSSATRLFATLAPSSMIIEAVVSSASLLIPEFAQFVSRLPRTFPSALRWEGGRGWIEGRLISSRMIP